MRFPAILVARCLAVVVPLIVVSALSAAESPPAPADFDPQSSANEPFLTHVDTPSSSEGVPAPATGEEQLPRNEQATPLEDATEEPFDERNFGEDLLVLPVDHFFGDWCGYRTELEAGGIKPTLTFVSDMLGNPVGGMRRGFTEADNLGFSALFDLEKLYCVEGGSFLFSMSQRSGANLSAIDIGNTFTTQQVFGGSTFKVVDMGYKQKLWDDDVEFQIGRIAAGDDFLVSPYNYVFVQNGFCGNPVGIFFNSPGMNSYPNATWGSLLKVRPTERTYVMGGIYNGDATIRDPDNHGLDMSLDGPAFVIVEGAYQTNQRKGDDGLPGNYKIGSWFDGNDFPDLSTQALATANPGSGLVVPMHQGNYGFYGLFDQGLVRFSGREEPILRGWGVVASAIISPDQTLSQMPYFVNAGVVARGLDPDRPRDVAALGILFGEFSNDLRSGQRDAQQFDPTIGVQDHETALEGTYIFRYMNGAYFIQPDMQYIIRPGGTGQIPNALVMGAQLGFNF